MSDASPYINGEPVSQLMRQVPVKLARFKAEERRAESEERKAKRTRKTILERKAKHVHQL
jgi:hypothetical protein